MPDLIVPRKEEEFIESDDTYTIPRDFEDWQDYQEWEDRDEFKELGE